jgi:hypothetical protein
MTNRRQHTVPQFYLKPFLSPGFVYRLGDTEPRRTNHPGNTAVRKDYYVREEPELDTINRKMEDDGAPALRKLIQNTGSITFDDWVNLSWLIANLWIRTPSQIDDMLTTYRQVYSEIRSMVEPIALKVKEGVVDPPSESSFHKSGNSTRYTVEEIQEIDDYLKVRDAYLLSAEQSFKQLSAIARGIQEMHFFLVHAPKGRYFITSDRPFVLRSMLTGSRVGVGLANSDAMASIPLCPTTVLVMMHGESGCISEAEATAEHVDFLNLQMMSFANQEVYSRFESQETHDWMRGRGRWQ